MDRETDKRRDTFGVAQTATQQKKWEECSIEEKIERLRMDSIQKKHREDAFWKMIQQHQQELILFESHQHDNMGGIHIPLRDARNRDLISGSLAQMTLSFDPLA